MRRGGVAEDEESAKGQLLESINFLNSKSLAEWMTRNTREM